MDAKPRLSVITPVYNGAGFVRRCYNNLIEQSFKNWEWVVIDDGSTDSTADIIREIDDPRVRLFSYKQNKGRGYARNMAIEKSRGDWIVIWDIDDLNFPERLDTTERMLKDHDFLCSYSVVINNNMKIKGVRGFHDPSSCLPKGFVHNTLALKKEIAEEIKYKITRGKGGPAEDARIVWTLSLKYNGIWLEDALTIYQEEREVNLGKAIDTNIAQLETVRELKSGGLIKSGVKYYLAAVKYLVKIFILNIMRVYPGLYLKSIDFRDYGHLKDGWTLSSDKIAYIKNIRPAL